MPDVTIPVELLGPLTEFLQAFQTQKDTAVASETAQASLTAVQQQTATMLQQAQQQADDAAKTADQAKSQVQKTLQDLRAAEDAFLNAQPTPAGPTTGQAQASPRISDQLEQQLSTRKGLIGAGTGSIPWDIILPLILNWLQNRTK